MWQTAALRMPLTATALRSKGAQSCVKSVGLTFMHTLGITEVLAALKSHLTPLPGCNTRRKPPLQPEQGECQTEASDTPAQDNINRVCMHPARPHACAATARARSSALIHHPETLLCQTCAVARAVAVPNTQRCTAQDTNAVRSTLTVMPDTKAAAGRYA
jgi:hypothetical protein